MMVLGDGFAEPLMLQPCPWQKSLRPTLGLLSRMAFMLGYLFRVGNWDEAQCLFQRPASSPIATEVLATSRIMLRTLNLALNAHNCDQRPRAGLFDVLSVPFAVHMMMSSEPLPLFRWPRPCSWAGMRPSLGPFRARLPLAGGFSQLRLACYQALGSPLGS